MEGYKIRPYIKTNTVMIRGGLEFTVKDAFGRLRKEELNRLRKMADYPIRSNLNKADLLSAISDNFRKDPVKLLMRLPVYDLQYLAEMCSIDRDSTLCIDAFPDMLYIQEFNICEWIIDGDGMTQEMWLADEMYSLISPFIDEVVSDVRKSGRFVIEYFFWGMLWLYGFPHSADFLEIIKKEFGQEEDDWYPPFLELCRYYPFEDFNNDNLIVHPVIGDLLFQLDEQEERGFDKKPMKEYSFKEVVEIGSTGPYFLYDKCRKEYSAAKKALMKCGHDEPGAEARLSQIWLDLQNVDGYIPPTKIVQRAIGEKARLTSEADFNSVIQSLFAYMNSLPRWMLGGRVPTEVSGPKGGHEKAVSIMTAMDRVSSMMAGGSKSVGRNDPCPCGSGLKYKNCHGKNIS